MHKFFVQMLCPAMLFMAGSLAMAQDKEPLEDPLNQQSQQNMASKTGIIETHESEPVMSPVTNTGANEGPALAALNDRAVQANNTYMAPGSCLVVDALVREFCNANPGDITCQF